MKHSCEEKKLKPQRCWKPEPVAPPERRQTFSIMKTRQQKLFDEVKQQKDLNRKRVTVADMFPPESYKKTQMKMVFFVLVPFFS